MADPTQTPILPRQQASLSDPHGFPVTEWYDFFRDLLGRINDDEGLRAEIEAILARLETLEGAAIVGPQSVQVFGSLSDGLVTLMLRNDEPFPSPLFYYGTDPIGNKGWQPAASLVEYLVDENGDYLVDEAGNFLIGADITADLFAIVSTTSGIVSHTGAGAWEARTLTEGNGIAITDGDGVAGNPTIAVESPLLGLVSTPAQLTSNTDNLAISATAELFRLSTDASRNLTGLQGGVDGRRGVLSNVGAFDLVLVHDATSTAANRFLCPNSANLTLHPNDSSPVWYDGTSSRWRVIGN